MATAGADRREGLWFRPEKVNITFWWPPKESEQTNVASVSFPATTAEATERYQTGPSSPYIYSPRVRLWPLHSLEFSPGRRPGGGRGGHTAYCSKWTLWGFFMAGSIKVIVSACSSVRTCIFIQETWTMEQLQVCFWTQSDSDWEPKARRQVLHLHIIFIKHQQSCNRWPWFMDLFIFFFLSLLTDPLLQTWINHKLYNPGNSIRVGLERQLWTTRADSALPAQKSSFTLST